MFAFWLRDLAAQHGGRGSASLPAPTLPIAATLHRKGRLESRQPRQKPAAGGQPSEKLTSTDSCVCDMASSAQQQQQTGAGATGPTAAARQLHQHPSPDPAAPAPPPQPMAAPLPGHLQHAAHKALSDLQAMRLLYPQQCKEAERQGDSARDDAERWVGG
jgi:hypothetical protein